MQMRCSGRGIQHLGELGGKGANDEGIVDFNVDD